MEKKKAKNQLGLTIFFVILCVLVLLPFVIIFSISFSNEQSIADFGYSIFPRDFDISAYKYIFKNPQSVINAYKVTTIFSVLGMALSVLFMSMIAYTLSKKNLRGKKALSLYLYFTTLFNGGLVPTYILMTQYLHLNDTIWIYILPSLIIPWHIFMMRTFFQGIPSEIAESALVDGANEYIIFFKMILPLSKPMLATIALLVFLGKWNDWYMSMLYINNDKLVSLQYLLQRIMQNIKLLQDNTIDSSMILASSEIPTETVRMAMAVVVAGPALLVFPFFQKYFVKGLTVGSVKG